MPGAGSIAARPGPGVSSRGGVDARVRSGRASRARAAARRRAGSRESSCDTRSRHAPRIQRGCPVDARRAARRLHRCQTQGRRRVDEAALATGVGGACARPPRNAGVATLPVHAGATDSLRFQFIDAARNGLGEQVQQRCGRVEGDLESLVVQPESYDRWAAQGFRTLLNWIPNCAKLEA